MFVCSGREVSVFHGRSGFCFPLPIRFALPLLPADFRPAGSCPPPRASRTNFKK
ncbi:hypothetical protein [Methanimicrococcus hongohii]|uniref:hypothetical protein n=1 Tax=Methanimicrococcus hongohii TaxID=3028295 RepID=UPI00292D2355|nr:hypothetical protein [Methanimicrococcus sp. Hf6]